MRKRRSSSSVSLQQGNAIAARYSDPHHHPQKRCKDLIRPSELEKLLLADEEDDKEEEEGRGHSCSKCRELEARDLLLREIWQSLQAAIAGRTTEDSSSSSSSSGLRVINLSGSHGVEDTEEQSASNYKAASAFLGLGIVSVLGGGHGAADTEEHSASNYEASANETAHNVV